MKKLLFIALSAAIFSASVSAVETHQCPRVLEVSLQSFDLNYPEDIAPQASESLRKSALKTRSDFEKLGRLKVKYVLKFAGGEKCYYEGRNQKGQYYRAKLENANAGQSSPYKLVNKNGTMAAEIAITEVKRSGLGINLDDPHAKLYHFEKSCQNSPCTTQYTKIGKGTLRSLK